MKKNSKKRIKSILGLVLDSIAELYPYFAVIYLVCFVLSLLFIRWKMFFNWPVFHISVLVLGILSLLSSKVRPSIVSLSQDKETKSGAPILWKDAIFSKKPMPLTERIRNTFRFIIWGFLTLAKTIAAFAKHMTKKSWRFLILIPKKIFKEARENLSKKDYCKMGIIVVVLIFALFQRIEVIDFFVLSYALISILFVMESRIAVGIALACLICCPFLLIQKNGVLAETTAVYAYYFLVITVLTQIREHRRESRDVPR